MCSRSLVLSSKILFDLIMKVLTSIFSMFGNFTKVDFEVSRFLFMLGAKDWRLGCF